MINTLDAFPVSDILSFWFGDDLADIQQVQSKSRLWFRVDPQQDKKITEQFGHWIDVVNTAEVEAFDLPKALLAAVIVVDQFPRNCYRGTPAAFAYDAKAMALTNHALERGFNKHLHSVEESFLLMPFQHIEDYVEQARGVEYFRQLADRAPNSLQPMLEGAWKYAVEHCDIIQRFGRFPHRNRILGRPSSPEEVEYLNKDGRSFGQ